MSMLLLRSFPATIPPHRAYVVDELPRFTQSDYDYTGLADLGADICLIEWDIAVAREQLERFMTHAAARPRDVLVAPHRLYHVAHDEPVWAHRVVDADGSERWLRSGELEADYVAFGLIYLPQTLIQAFVSAPAPERGRSPFLPAACGYTDCRFIDQTFSVWHRHALGRRVAVDWTVRPVHLHYTIS